MFIYSKKFHEYSICVLDVLTAAAYQKIAKIADRQASVQIVVGKSVVAGLTNLYVNHIASIQTAS
jgi:hypothetical protein